MELQHLALSDPGLIPDFSPRRVFDLVFLIRSLELQHLALSDPSLIPDFSPRRVFDLFFLIRSEFNLCNLRSPRRSPSTAEAGNLWTDPLTNRPRDRPIHLKSRQPIAPRYFKPAFVRPRASSADPGAVRKLMQSRFHALMMATAKVSSVISVSLNCFRVRS